MEQKRKVKSLISTTETSELWFLSKLLVVLSCLFYFWALFLIIFSVSFVRADEEEKKMFSYTWFDEKIEVIYDLGFVRNWNLSKIISTMKVNDDMGIDRLYVSPVPVVIYYQNGLIGKFTSGNYVNLLWWKDIVITWSDNISIIWWKNLSVASWNSNATIFWWKDNKINSINGDHNIIIWWQDNTVGWKNSVILWWEGNVITWKNSFILWWGNNRVFSNNAIVAWINVTASKDNIFVFSYDNDWFTPEKGNTFYINVQEWLWVNTRYMMENPEVKTWVMVYGAVKFWNLWDCSDWLIWLNNNSLHWCSGLSQKELWNVDNSWLTGDDFIWYCTGVDYLKFLDGEERYHLCSNSIEGYKNVIFETKILSWDCENISNWKNPCVYKCADGYSYDESTKTCKKDCKIPWNENYKKHGEIITWYTVDNVVCSPWNTCNSNMAKLKCVDGDWTKNWGDGPDIDYDSEWKINYKYENCRNKKNESCDKNEYKFDMKVNKYWEQDGQDCVDYDENTCQPHTYYKWGCYPNYTFVEGNCLVGNSSKNNCKCVPKTQTGTCSDLSLPQNAIKLVTGFKQTASGYSDWYPRSKNYEYVSSKKGECTYKCDTGYLYSTWNKKLNVLTGCWSGCKLPWGEEIVNHGTVITGYLRSELSCFVFNNCDIFSAKMICGTWWMWQDFIKYTTKWKEPGKKIYNNKWEIYYKYETCDCK